MNQEQKIDPPSRGEINLDEIVRLAGQVDYIILGGYANSGKSTLLKQLEEAVCVEVASLSLVCHRIIEAWHGQAIDSKNPEVRKRFINFIEEGLMKNIGREAMVRGCMKDRGDNHVVLIETIGGDELKMFMQNIPLYVSIVMINARSSQEQPNADKRLLLDDAFDYYWENANGTIRERSIEIANRNMKRRNTDTSQRDWEEVLREEDG